jgi:AraC-like DNA-binding protein
MHQGHVAQRLFGLGLRHQSALLYFVGDCVSAKFARKPTHRVIWWVRRDRVVFDVTALQAFEDAVLKAISRTGRRIVMASVLSRAFREETGQTPAKAVERLRVEVARLMPEEGRHTVETVA